MSAMNGKVVAPMGVFSLEVKIPGGASEVAKGFARDRGAEQVVELLAAAGLKHGPWQLHVTEGVTASAHTPAVSVRRPQGAGVLLRLKPGGKNSCVLAVLTPPRIGPKPMELFQMLQAVLTQKPAEVKAVPEPIVKAEPKAAAKLSLAELLARGEEKLKALMAAPARLKVITQHKGELEAKLAELQRDMDDVGAEYESLLREEEELSSGIDLEALELLIG